MRFYIDFKEALNEIKRDLNELAIRVHVPTVQDKYVADDPDYDTMELQSYIYTVLNPRIEDLSVTQPWANLEWEERIECRLVNPGKAWEARKEVWAEFLHDGRFAYTYSERIGTQVRQLIDELRCHPESRQLFLGIWSPQVDIHNLGGLARVPCSLGYWFIKRQNRLDMTYLQRSCDYSTHMQNDLYLATKLLRYVADQVGITVVHLIHWVGSLHVFAKDVEGTF